MFRQTTGSRLAVQFVLGSQSKSPKIKTISHLIVRIEITIIIIKKNREHNLLIQQSKGPSGKRKREKKSFQEDKTMAHVCSWSKRLLFFLHRITSVTPRYGGGYPARPFRACNTSHSSLRHLGGCWILLNTTGILENRNHCR